MRYRIWIPLSAILFSLALFATARWYQSDAVQSAIRHFVEEKIAAGTKGSVRIGSLRLGILAITAGDIELAIPKSGIDLTVEKIRLGFSLEALLKRNWSPAELIDRITIINPTLTVTLQEKSDAAFPSLRVRELVPFRTARVRGARVTVFSQSKSKLIAVNGLNGSIDRQGNSADLLLDGAVGSFTENVSLFYHLSDTISERHLSLRVKNLALQQIVPVQSAGVRGILNGSFECDFRSGGFPHNIIPEGQITVEKLQVKKDKSILLTNGSILLVAENGAIRTERCSAEIGGGSVRGAAEILLEPESISAVGTASITLDGRKKPIPPFTDITGSARLTFAIPSVLAPAVSFDFKTALTVQKEEISASGEGSFNDKTVQIRSAKLFTRFGSIEGNALYREGSTRANGSAQLAYAINSQYRIDGTVPFRVAFAKGATVPTFSLTCADLVVTTPQGVVPVPPVTAQSAGKGATVRLSNREMRADLTIDELANPLKSYRGSATLFPEGTTRALDLAGKSGILSSGTATLNFTGKNGITAFHGSGSGKSGHDHLSIFASGSWGGKQNAVSIDQGVYSRDGYDFPFTANLTETKRGWETEIAAVSGKFIAQGVISSDFDSLTAFGANIAKSELDQLNAFLPESDFPIRGGTVSASFFASGPMDSLKVDGFVDVDGFAIGGLDSIRTSLKLQWLANRGTIAPFSVTRYRQTLVTSDSIFFGDTVRANLELVRFDMGKFLEGQEGVPVTGIANGSITVDSRGVTIVAQAPQIRRGPLILDSISARATIANDTLRVSSLKFTHFKTDAELTLAAPLKNRHTDTLTFSLRARGDLLGSAGQFKESPIGGTGSGTIRMDGSVCNGEWQFTTARLLIPDGSLAVYPYVRGTVDHLYADLKLIRNDSIALTARGKIGGREAVIKNDYAIGPLKPMLFGDINLGVIRLYTEEGGIPLFIPGFLENRKGNVGFIELAGKDSIPAATLSGTPPDDFMATATLLLRKAEITFPLLQDVEWPSDFDPFPMVGFDLDVQAADRSITYFYQLGNQKKRRALRLIEANIDPSYTIGVRGRYQDGDFRVTGGIRAYKGFLFYGKLFDQNFELGLDFSSGKVQGEHDNLPVIWASAETYSDSNRLDRSEVVLMTKDPKTGELVRRGRLIDPVVVPASGIIDEQRDQNDQSAEFYRSTGRDIIRIEGAGSTITGIGDVYVNSFLFNYWGRRLARKLNFDLLRIETSVMSNTFNYLYDSQTDSAFQGKWTHLALANTGLTFGKYIANDQIMIKMRSQLSSVKDTLLVPELKLGLEYQPLRYLWMDLNYGLKKDLETAGIILNPEIRIQLRMPFSRLESAVKNR